MAPTVPVTAWEDDPGECVARYSAALSPVTICSGWS